MKTLLLTLLLITSAAQAEQWLVNGLTYNGTFHKFSADRTMVYVTSDRDNYKGSWIKVAALDPATRVRLRVATPQEQAAVQAQMEQRRLLQAQAQTPANAGYAASVAEQQLNLQRVEEARRQAAAYRAIPTTTTHHPPQVPHVHVPHVHTPVIPHVQQPIIIRTN